MTSDDLALHRPGQAAREQARALRDAAPVKTFLARVLQVHTEEGAWRIGADGEAAVARRLNRLDDAWRVLHAIPVGSRGSDIDHLMVGPAGVFSLNAKHHPGARVRVAGDDVLVNGRWQPYVRISRHEARRASRLLTTRVGPTAVQGLVVVCGAGDLSVTEQPADVHLVNSRRVVRWLQKQPSFLDADAVDEVYEAARRRSTWQPA